jgi:hypothetical protein
MKSIDEKSGDGELFSDEALESALRDLPPVKVPAALEGRLIAAIPRQLTVARPERHTAWRRSWLVVGTAAAVAVAASVVISVREDNDDPQRNDLAAAGIPSDVLAIRDIHSKEIDPCNILPPIRDWR